MVDARKRHDLARQPRARGKGAGIAFDRKGILFLARDPVVVRQDVGCIRHIGITVGEERKRQPGIEFRLAPVGKGMRTQGAQRKAFRPARQNDARLPRIDQHGARATASSPPAHCASMLRPET